MGLFTFRLGSEHLLRGFPVCPACGYQVDASSTVAGHGIEDGQRAPADGNMSICIACAGVSIFTDDATRLRLPTADERGKIARSPAVQAVAQSIIELRDRDGQWPKGTKP